MDPTSTSTISCSEIVTAVRRKQLVRALRSVDTALEKLEERGQVTGLHRLRDDLRAELRLSAAA
jgi:hypothetical protein